MLHPGRVGGYLVVAGFLGACTSDRSAHTSDAEAGNATPRTVTVGSADFSFNAPDSLAAGATTFRLTNQGKEVHQAQLVRLEDGKTLDDLAKAMKEHGPPPAWVKFVGGPNAAAPGQEVHATAVLEPGQYAYLCLIPSPDGVLHVAKGMARPFVVTEARAGSDELPAADATIKLVDYGFETARPLEPGKQTILVENAGPQPHEVVLVRLAPGKKVEDFGTWAMTGMKGPPPAEPLGGVVILDKGARGTFEVELTPGDYGLICFVPDTKDGKPHLAHGMMKTFKVS